MLLIAEATSQIPAWFDNVIRVLQVLIGFSVIIFFHELGHFLAAKWVGIRVNQFAVGFGTRVVGYRAGEGLTFGNRPEYSADEIARRGYGETDYCLRLLPIGGYVKMLGQDDVLVDEKTGEITLSDDPRAFPSRPVGQRMIVVSAGVIFNLLFAAALLTGVFLIGRTAMPAEIGVVPPDSPAYGKLQIGDRVLTVEGRSVSTFKDLVVGSIMAGDQVTLEIERDGRRLPEPITVETTMREQVGLKLLQVEPPLDPVFAQDAPSVDGKPAPQKGDRVIAVNGTPIESWLDIAFAFAESHGEAVQFTVERPAEDGGAPSEVVCYLRPYTAFSSVRRPFAPDEAASPDTARHLLGMERRQTIRQVLPGSAADQAGLQPDDVLVQFGSVANPVYEEITEVIEARADQAVPLRVLRDGETVDLTIKPRRKFRLFGEGKAQIGVVFQPEEDAILANTLPGTPVGDLEIPRGVRIVGVGDVEVETWADVVEALLDRAGETVTLKYVVGNSVVGRPFEVPSSLIDQLGLTPLSVITAVDGARTYTGTNPETGAPVETRFNSPWAIREYLREHVGETVEVTYRPRHDAEPVTASFGVTEDTIDPWQMRVTYPGQGLDYSPKETRISADGNPVTAFMMGVREVKNVVLEVYFFLRSIVSRENVSVEHVSGPVGIVSVAVERARAGMVELLYFIAFLSVNLAVFNFLPIPVMDGGLMVFLLIEKIKGKPLSLKTQMVSTLVGLAAILLIGLIVTFQDIGRLFQ